MGFEASAGDCVRRFVHLLPLPRRFRWLRCLAASGFGGQGTVAAACERLRFWKANRARNRNPSHGHLSGSGTPLGSYSTVRPWTCSR